MKLIFKPVVCLKCGGPFIAHESLWIELKDDEMSVAHNIGFGGANISCSKCGELHQYEADKDKLTIRIVAVPVDYKGSSSEVFYSKDFYTDAFVEFIINEEDVSSSESAKNEGDANPIEPVENKLSFFEKIRNIFVVDQKEVSTELNNLPTEVTFPRHLKNKMRYDISAEQLFYKGVMSQREKQKLLSLSEDINYKRAIKSLFLKSLDSDPAGLRAYMFLNAGAGDDSFIYDKKVLTSSVNELGVRLVEYFSDALTKSSWASKNAIKLLNSIAENKDIEQGISKQANAELKEFHEMKNKKAG